MLKKVLMTGLMITVMLSVSACGKDSVGTSGTVEDTAIESPVADSQPTDAETQGTAEESLQPTEELAEEVSASYIFSEMPIAAYEVTGLGVGLNAEVYGEHVFAPEDGYDFGVVPMIKLDESNTFILFCLQADEADYVSTATIHSPSSSSQWEANQYTCLDFTMPEIEGYSSGQPCLTKQGSYNEEKLNGSFVGLVDPWTEYIRLAEIYHPDAPQEDTIYAIEVAPFLYDEAYDEVDEVVAEMVCIFEKIGATNVQEISVEEALERCDIIVSQ